MGHFVTPYTGKKGMNMVIVGIITISYDRNRNNFGKPVTIELPNNFVKLTRDDENGRACADLPGKHNCFISR